MVGGEKKRGKGGKISGIISTAGKKHVRTSEAKNRIINLGL